MAINKRKILQSAQKNLQKGALDKALKDYTSLLEADPRDVNLRLKVGDIHLKQGKSGEAAAAYQKVAERFMKDGFDAKAVALFKQITRIDPKRFEVYIPLSELYQRLGLKGDALEALQTAADARYKEGDKPGALELLRKMANVDPTNTTNRLKVAELLRQEGMNEEALAEYDAVAEELGRQGEVEGRMNVLQKALDLDSDRVESLEALGRCYVERRRFEDAEAIALRLVSEFSEHAVEGYEILTEVMTGQGREGEELTTAYRSMAHALRDRGEEDRAREILQRYAPISALSIDPTDAATAEDLKLDESEVAAFDAAIGGPGEFADSGSAGVAPDPDPDPDPGLITDSGLRLDTPSEAVDQVDGTRRKVATGASNDATATGLPPLPSLDDADAPVLKEAAAPADATDEDAEPVDVEQLLAEASVLVRYGKHDRAIESLRSVLAHDPMNRGALEKLGISLQATGDTENAVEAWLRAGRAALSAGDEAGVAELRARIEAVDAAAAAQLDAPAATDPDAGGDFPDDGIEIDIEDELEIDGEAELPAAEARSEADLTVFQVQPDEGPDPEPPLAAADEESGDEVELDLEEPVEDAAAGAAASGGAELDGDEFAGAFGGEVVADLREGIGTIDEEPDEVLLDEQPVPEPIEFDDGEEEFDNDVAPAAEPAAAHGVSSTTQQQIDEEIEEAAFFLAQDMLDEAEAVYQRILERAPSHPQVLVRMGELEARRNAAAEAAAPETDTESAADDALEAGADEERSGSRDDDDTGEFSIDLGDDDEFSLDDEAMDELDLGSDEAEPSELADAASGGAVIGSDTTEVEEIAGDDASAYEVAAAEDELAEDDSAEHASGEDDVVVDDDDEAAEDEADAGEAESDAEFQPEALELTDAAEKSEPEPEPEPEPEAAADDTLEAESALSEAGVESPEADLAEDLDQAADAASLDAATHEAAATDEVDEPADDGAVAEDVLIPEADTPLPDLTAECEAPSGPLPQAAETDPGLGVAAGAEASSGTDIMDGGFDLAAELSDAFEDDAPSMRGVPRTTEEEGFEQVFAAFKRGVEEELADEGYQARWDLGIAYKEMGLLEDAIGEFRSAMNDGGPQAQCLHMMGVCALDLGRGPDAVAHIEQALSGSEIAREEEVALRFDLGRAHQSTGDVARARSAFEAVAAADPEFCEVSSILEALDDDADPQEASQDAAGEVFESFDDLLGDDAADPAPAAAEEYESFDDLMEEDDDDSDDGNVEPEPVGDSDESPALGAEADEPDDEGAGDPEPEASAAPEPEPSAAPEPEGVEAAEPDEPGPKKRKRRKKKISFL